ncbi:MAG: hypothetical protein EWV59_09820 [Microcystis aeruginosa Ma_MB_F_20061100_S19D]|nr:MAG: hypothetical protein EWV59_09820 [Microcystis aeruginosa Ma_MB_F_20061100_S19D]
MQAYKLKGKIDQSGNLVITEPLNLPPRKRPTKIKVLQNWFEKTQPAPPDFDPDQAKWEYLKEKHNL